MDWFMKYKIARICSLAIFFLCSIAKDIYAATCEPAGNVNTLVTTCFNGTYDTVELGGFSYLLLGPILIPPPLNGNNGLPVINFPVTVKNGSISGQANPTNPFRIFEVDAGGILSLSNVTLSDGVASGAVSPASDGGAILVYGGELSVDGSTFIGNNATNGGGAGGG